MKNVKLGIVNNYVRMGLLIAGLITSVLPANAATPDLAPTQSVSTFTTDTAFHGSSIQSNSAFDTDVATPSLTLTQKIESALTAVKNKLAAIKNSIVSHPIITGLATAAIIGTVYKARQPSAQKNSSLNTVNNATNTAHTAIPNKAPHPDQEQLRNNPPVSDSHITKKTDSIKTQATPLTRNNRTPYFDDIYDDGSSDASDGRITQKTGPKATSSTRKNSTTLYFDDISDSDSEDVDDITSQQSDAAGKPDIDTRVASSSKYKASHHPRTNSSHKSHTIDSTKKTKQKTDNTRSTKIQYDHQTLIKAIDDGDIDTVNALCDQHDTQQCTIDFNAQGTSVLHYAYDKMKFFLDTKKQNRPIFTRIANCNGINLDELDSDGKTILIKALSRYNCDLDTVRMLCKKGVDINQPTMEYKGDFWRFSDWHWDKTENVTPILWAVKKNKLDVCKILLGRKDVDLGGQDHNNDTAIHYSILTIDIRNEDDKKVKPIKQEIFTALLDCVKRTKQDAVLAIKNKDGQTPLFTAVRARGTENAIKSLVALHAPVNEPDNNGKTALIDAGRDVDVVKILLAHKDIKVDAVDAQGNTALYYAAQGFYHAVRTWDLSEYTTTVDLLLKAGANSTIEYPDGWNLLAFAVATNNIPMATELLNKGVNQNAATMTHANDPRQYGYGSSPNNLLTPLMWAIYEDNIDMCNLLLGNPRININAQDINQSTALHHIIISMQKANDDRKALKKAMLCKLLERNDLVIDSKNDQNKTPLHEAIFLNDRKVLRALILRGADVNKKGDAENLPALTLASMHGYADMVEELLLVNRQEVPSLRKQDWQIKTTLSPDSAPTLDQSTDSLIAGYLGYVDLDAEDTTNKKTALYHAITSNKKTATAEQKQKIVNLLVNSKANIHTIHADGNPMEYAVNANDTDLVNSLIAKKIKVRGSLLSKLIATAHSKNNAPMVTALQQIQNAQNTDFLRELETDGDDKETEMALQQALYLVDIHAKNAAGDTLLHVAARNGDINSVTYLLQQENQTLINEQNGHGQTALMIAAKEYNTDIARLLVQKGATIPTVDPNGFTALHYATISESLKIVTMLLEQGAEPDEGNGKTALMHAAKQGNFEIATQLLNGTHKQAHPCAVYQQGTGAKKITLTPLLCAVQGGDADLVTLLIEKMQHTPSPDSLGACANAWEFALHRNYVTGAFKQALTNRHTEIIKKLLPFNVKNSDNTQMIASWCTLVDKGPQQKKQSKRDGEDHVKQIKQMLPGAVITALQERLVQLDDQPDDAQARTVKQIEQIKQQRTQLEQEIQLLTELVAKEQADVAAAAQDDSNE